MHLKQVNCGDPTQYVHTIHVGINWRTLPSGDRVTNNLTYLPAHVLGHSTAFLCASLLHIISCMISARQGMFILSVCY